MTEITQVSAPSDIDAARALMREYTTWVLSQDDDLIGSPPFTGVEAELATLPGAFQPPLGSLLLARHEGRAVGCIAFRPVGDGVAEVKRLYVLPDQRGRGVARDLVNTMLAEAKTQGHRRLILDSFHTMTAAHKMYRSVGFRDCAGPDDFPNDLRDKGVFMEMDLN